MSLYSEEPTCAAPQGTTQAACGTTLTCAPGASVLTCNVTGPTPVSICWKTDDPTGPCPCQPCIAGNTCSQGQCVPLCPAGFAQCPSGCSDTSSDAANCGSCGTACNGQTCVEGHCVAASSIQFVTGLSAPSGLAVDATNLYVTDPGTNTVWQVNKTTLAQTPLGTSQANPGAIAVDGAYAYWSSAGGQAILRAPIGGATPFQPVYSTGAGDRLLAVDDVDVYWVDQAGIHAAAKAGGGAVRGLPGNPNTSMPSYLSQDQGGLYGIFSGFYPSAFSTVGRLDKTTGALTTYWGQSGQTGPLLASAMDASNLYTLEAYGTGDPNILGPPSPIPKGRLYRQPKSGGAVLSDDVPAPEGSPSAEYAPTWMAADGCTVYWSTGTKIYRASPGGSPPHVLTNAAVSAGEIVLDDTYVYWVDSGWIGRVAR